MVIGGHDFVLPPFDQAGRDLALAVVREAWPSAVVEVEREDVFVFRDETARRAWEDHGATEVQGDGMLHMIFTKHQTTAKRDLSWLSTEDLLTELRARQRMEEPVSRDKNGPPIPFPRPLSSPTQTLGQVWPLFDARFYEGCYCECCGQRVQLYPRKGYGAVAVFLIWLVQTCTDEKPWASIHEAPMLQGRRGGGDKDKLKFFGLAEEKPNDSDPSKRSSGFWRPTSLGRRFVRGEVTIAKTAWGFNGQCLGFSDERVTIQDALGDKYDYREVMGRQW